MSLTDEELRAEKIRPEVGGVRVCVNANSVSHLGDKGREVHLRVNRYMECAFTNLSVAEATELRDNLTAVIDQYHDFVARRDAKTNREPIDEMPPGTVFEYHAPDGHWFGGNSDKWVKLANGQVMHAETGTTLSSGAFNGTGWTIVEVEL